MSLVERICDDLRVRVGEVWIGNDGNNYYINYHGQLCKVTYKDNLEEDVYYSPDKVERVLSGELKPIWKPKAGEIYYVPSITMEDKYIPLTWTETEGDRRNQERGAVFKTKEEAIEMADKILKIVKEEIIEMGNRVLNIAEEER